MRRAEGQITIVIADDQAAVRASFASILGTHPRLQVVGQAVDGIDALDLVTRLRPQVLLTDIRMPRLDGLALSGLLRDDPITRVVVITTFDLDDYVRSALQNGAHGFILKRSRPQLLIEAVLAAASGDALISPQLTLRLLGGDGRPSADLLADITPREREVAHQVALGRSNAEIARELYISAGTVKTHISNIQTKLGVSNRVGIAVRAWAGAARPANESGE